MNTVNWYEKSKYAWNKQVECYSIRAIEHIVNSY